VGRFFRGFFLSFNPGPSSGSSLGTSPSSESSPYGMSSPSDILSPGFGFLPFLGFFGLSDFDFDFGTSSGSSKLDGSESPSSGISSLPCFEGREGRFSRGFFFLFNPGPSSGSSLGTSPSSESSPYGMSSSSMFLSPDFSFLPFFGFFGFPEFGFDLGTSSGSYISDGSESTSSGDSSWSCFEGCVARFFRGCFLSLSPGPSSKSSPGAPASTGSSPKGTSSSPAILSPSFGFLPFFGFFGSPDFDLGTPTSFELSGSGSDGSESTSSSS